MIRTAVIKNYLGVRFAEYRFGPKGAVLEGENATGKTSGIKAIRAALTGKGCSADAIRNGEDEAEIIVDLDDATVRRVITRTTSSVQVSAENGQRVKSPQTFLNELLGVAPFDPLDIVFEDDKKKRKAAILSAVPCKLSPELIDRWVPPNVERLRVPPEMHGLDALEVLRLDFYDRRTRANKDAKTAADEYDRAAKAANVVRPTGHVSGDAGDVRRELEEAKKEAARVEVRRQDVTAQTEQVRKTTWKIEQQEKGADIADADAATLKAKLPDADEANLKRTMAIDARTAASIAVDRAKKALRDAEEALQARTEDASEAENEVDELVALAREIVAYEAAARASRTAALSLKETLPSVPSTEELDEQAAKAKDRIDRASGWLTAHNDYMQWKLLETSAGEAAEHAKKAKARAKELDEIVRMLTDCAPGEILAAAGGITGLRIDGDSISLDGVLLDSLSGAEQLRFAVRIAKRLNEKAKFIIVDGLERLDTKQLPVFLEESTSDGFQVIATRVGEGIAHAVPIGGGS